MSVTFNGRLDAPMKARRVLIVEDHGIIAMLLADVLKAMGHVVAGIVATEADAVSAAAQCRPDLMVVDARLRQGSGISAVREINRAGFVPHVFVTGDNLCAGELAPDAIVIAKPYGRDQLAHAIQRALCSAPDRMTAGRS